MVWGRLPGGRPPSQAGAPVEEVEPGRGARHVPEPVVGPLRDYQSPEMSKAASGTATLTGCTLEHLPTSSRNSSHAVGCAILDNLSAKVF